MSRILLMAMLAGGVGLLLMGLGELLNYETDQGRYANLAQEVTAHPSSEGLHSEEEPHIFRNLPENAAAWVEVEGTDISLPVADGSRGDSWYLEHDLWDNRSELGCPFMDARCASPQDAHVMVYGHHLAFTNYMFSSLHLCYHQDHFLQLGDCCWTTREGTCSLKPLCALSVDSCWQDILRFSFSDKGELHDWLCSILNSSSARSKDAWALANGAQRIVTLVTCSSNRAGQPWRTLVLFVA